jgi:cytidine deaminase
VLSEFCKEDFEIHLFNGEEIKTFTLGELLPESFNL